MQCIVNAVEKVNDKLQYLDVGFRVPFQFKIVILCEFSTYLKETAGSSRNVILEIISTAFENKVLLNTSKT